MNLLFGTVFNIYVIRKLLTWTWFQLY